MSGDNGISGEERFLCSSLDADSLPGHPTMRFQQRRMIDPTFPLRGRDQDVVGDSKHFRCRGDDQRRNVS